MDAYEVYVALNGNDENAGTIDAPFRTLEAARDYVREINDGTKPVIVYIRGGTYVLSKSFELTDADSGTEEAPVTYRAYPGEKVIISGSPVASWSHFVPVEGEMKDLLPTDDAKNNVMVADASALGISRIQIGTENQNFVIKAPMIMLDGHSMMLVRYHNNYSSEGWMEVETVDPTRESGTYPVIKIEDDEYWRWTYNTDQFVYYSYISYGWATHAFFGERNVAEKTVTSLQPSHYGSSFGAKATQIYNVYEALDEPGEWYYDITTDKLYIYPFADTTANSRLYISSGNFDMISLTGASYINIEGVTITSSNKDGVKMSNVDHCVVNNCKLLSFRGKAFNQDSGVNSGIKNSEVAYAVSTAIYLNGGDYVTMTPSNSFISNNLIHDTGIYMPVLYPGVKLRGVKNSFDHNEFYNTPGMALDFAAAGESRTSLDCVIEYNVFHDVITNGKDLGAVYGGRDARCQGTIIRNNYFYNFGNGDNRYSHAALAIYVDDGLSGTTITNNIIGPGAASPQVLALSINSGHDTVFSNNLLIDMTGMFTMYRPTDYLTYMTVGDTAAGIAPTLRQIWDNELYTARYPWMVQARNGETDFYIDNTFADNIMLYIESAPNCVSSSYLDTSPWYNYNMGDNRLQGIDTNLIIEKGAYGDNRDLFADYENEDYTLNSTILSQTNFQNIDRSQMGMKAFTYDGKTYIPGGSEPVISNVTISGNPALGEEVNTSYDFADADGHTDTDTIVHFYYHVTNEDLFAPHWTLVSDNRVGNGFVVTPICEGKWIRAKVVPVDSSGRLGDPVWSDPVFVPIGTPADKTEFLALIAEAEAALDAAEIGSDPGMWTQKEVDLLTEAIAKAKVDLEPEVISQYNFDAMFAEFKTAYARFIGNRIAGEITNLQPVNPLLDDTANWVPYTNNTAAVPTFNADGSMTIVSDTNVAMGGYAGEKFSGKVFSFKYRQDLVEGKESWGGLYFNLGSAATIPWGDKSVLICIKDNKVELQIYGNEHTAIYKEYAGQVAASGTTHEINFGVYDVNSTDVRILLTVDGKVIFDEQITDTALIGKEGYFGVLAADFATVTISDAELRNLDIDEMIADEENWVPYANNTAAVPTFKSGKMTIVSDSNVAMGGYAGQKFSNKIFRFTYRQDLMEGKPSWGGLYFNLGSASTIPWGDKSLLVCIKDDKVELQIYGNEHTAIYKIYEGQVAASGTTHEITFGMYDVNTTDVRIIMTVDGQEIFNEVVSDTALIGKEGYFGVLAADYATVTIGQMSNEITVDNLIADEENWVPYTNNTAAKPKFIAGSMSITSDTNVAMGGYTGEKFSNKIYRFKYRQDLVEGKESWGGLYFNLGSAATIPWGDKSVLICIKDNKVELQIYGNEHTAIYKEYQGQVAASGTTHEITFGMYDVNTTDVCIVMTVDGQVIFNEVVSDTALIGKEGYFGVLAADYATVTISGLSNDLAVSTLINDKEGWTTGTGNAPTFENNSLAIGGLAADYEKAAYSAQKFQGKHYSFTYRQIISDELTDPDSRWGGLYWNLGNPTEFTWSDKGVLLILKDTKIELQVYGNDTNKIVSTASTTLANGKKIFQSGWTYDVLFAVEDINTTDIRILFEVNGETIFDEVVTETKLVGASGYFGVIAAPKVEVILNGVDNSEHYNKYDSVPLDAPLKDETNWVDFYTGTDSVVGNGQVSVTATADYSTAGYNKAFQNTIFKFKFQPDLSNGGWAGFGMNFVSPALYAWEQGGIIVQFTGSKSVLTGYTGTNITAFGTETTSFIVENNRVYDVTFGMYAINETETRIILTMDGDEIFNVVRKNPEFHCAPVYFSLNAVNNGSAIISGTGIKEEPGGDTDPTDPTPTDPVPTDPTPTDPTPSDSAEPTYDTVTVDTLLENPANWKGFSRLPEVTTEGIVSRCNYNNQFSMAGYTTKMKNTLFQFNFSQTYLTSANRGVFALNYDDVENQRPWEQTAIAALVYENQIQLRVYVDAVNVWAKDYDYTFTGGQAHLITFGSYAVDETTVRIVLKINDDVIASEDYENADFVNTESYFCVGNRFGEIEVTDETIEDKNAYFTVSKVAADYVAAIGDENFETLQEAVNAASAGQTIKLLKDVTIDTYATLNMVQGTNGQSGTYDVKAALVLNGINLDGDGHKLTVTGLGDKSADGADAAIWTNGATISNLTINGGARGIFYDGNLASDIVLNNVKIENSCRAINVSGGTTATYALTATGCTFAGKISYSPTALTSATFTSCSFTVQNGAKGDVLEPYTDTALADCTFAEGYALSASDLVAGKKITKSGTTNAAAPEGYIWDTDALVRCDILAIDTLLETPANWKGFSRLPEVTTEGIVSRCNYNNQFSMAGYTTKMKNTLFQFNFSQTYLTSANRGVFALNYDDVENQRPWEQTAIAALVYENQIQLRVYVDAVNVWAKDYDYTFTGGQAHLITFGSYAVDETTVRIVLKINDDVIASEDYENADFVNTESYFCVGNRFGEIEVTDETIEDKNAYFTVSKIAATQA